MRDAGTFFGKEIKLSAKLLGLSAGLVVPLVMGASDSWADMLKIMDSQGNTRSMIELESGAVAGVRVFLGKANDSASFDGAAVHLEDTISNRRVQTLTADSKGHCVFDGLSAGDYKLSLENDKLELKEVLVTRSVAGGEPQKVGAENSASVNKAMYVGGASAVAGVIGAVALSGSNSGSDGGNSQSLSLGTRFGEVSAQNVIDARAANPSVGDPNYPIPPNSGDVNPPATEGTFNNAPSVTQPNGPNDFGNPATEDPDVPTDIAPAPELNNPMTPTS